MKLLCLAVLLLSGCRPIAQPPRLSGETRARIQDAKQKGLELRIEHGERSCIVLAGDLWIGSAVGREKCRVLWWESRKAYGGGL